LQILANGKGQPASIDIINKCPDDRYPAIGQRTGESGLIIFDTGKLPTLTVW